MKSISISLACQNSDRTRALIDGRVAIEGVECNWVPVDPEEIFHRAFRYQEFDVCEMSLSTHLTLTSRQGSPFVGIPVFLSRAFRHSAIYVRKDVGIESARDLAGRNVGVPDYQQTAGLWVRGMLMDEYGVNPQEVKWHVGGQEQAGRAPRTEMPPIPGLSIQTIDSEATLSGLLLKGEIDAIISPRVPSCMAAHPALIGRLFNDFRAAEEAYFEKTKLFPLMHAVGIRRSLAEQHPWLAASLFKAFQTSKQLCFQDMKQVNFLRSSLPWLSDDLGRVQQLMGEDFWRYGITENLPELQAMTRYAYKDGLAERLVAVEELFAESVFNMFKI